jgi:hypothetical protein
MITIGTARPDQRSQLKIAGNARLTSELETADLVHRGDGVPQPQLGEGVRKQRKKPPKTPARGASQMPVLN